MKAGQKKRLGLGRPNLIYVKNFMVHGNQRLDSQEEKIMSGYTDSLEKDTDIQNGNGRDEDTAWNNKAQCDEENMPDSLKTEAADAAVLEKEYGIKDTGNVIDYAKVFADKTVEAMVKELLCRRKKQQLAGQLRKHFSNTL